MESKVTNFLPFLQQSSRFPKKMDIHQELQLYLETPGESADINPLYWWKTNSLNYPRLSEVAKKVLAIPATSAASERIFSTARLVMPWNRTRLAPDTMRAIMCLRNWLNIDLDEEDIDEEDYNIY